MRGKIRSATLYCHVWGVGAGKQYQAKRIAANIYATIEQVWQE
jgi:hypothetical protein